MVSLYKIAEKCQVILGKGDVQSLVSAVQDAYATCAKLSFYENKADGWNEVEGQLLYTFGKTAPLTPELDNYTGEYYIIIPSSFLALPHNMGIQWVSFMKDKQPFVQIENSGFWYGLKASILGGFQTYRPDGIRIYFPKMTKANAGNILLRLAIALDEVNSRENLNISPDMQDKIVEMVVKKFSPQERNTPNTLVN